MESLDELPDLERQLDGIEEQPLFRPEEMGDEGGIDPGLGGDGTDRRTVIAERCELPACGLSDSLARPARTGTSTPSLDSHSFSIFQRMMNSEASIRIRELRVRRGGRLVLPGISLDLRRGVVTGLLGPSGSGKTTLIRSIVGVQIVESGEVTVLGTPAGSPELRHVVGYMTQAPSVYGDLTVRENLHYFARVLGAGAERIRHAIETVALGDHADQVVATLSGGELSRVSLATALVGQPELLVLDEPTVGLDPVLRRDLWNTFHELAAAGTTLLVSSHVMDEAERCDDLVLLRDGRIVATGSPDELRHRTHADDLEDAFLALAEAS